MSPSKDIVNVNCAARPPPPHHNLKINRDSHAINVKSSSSSSSSNSSTFTSFAALRRHQQQQRPQRHHPVIIYTHSPKVIHILPRDFLSLVQKLTGLARSDAQDPRAPSRDDVGSSVQSDANVNYTSSTSVVTSDENSSSCVSTTVFDHHHHPLFTPNPDQLFCSSRPFYRYPETVLMSSNSSNSASVNGTASISPSVLEVIRGAGLPEY